MGLPLLVGLTMEAQINISKETALSAMVALKCEKCKYDKLVNIKDLPYSVANEYANHAARIASAMAELHMELLRLNGGYTSAGI